MKIAVAGVKHVCNSQLIFGCNTINIREHLRQTRTRYDRILNHRVGRDAADGAERAFARGP